MEGNEESRSKRAIAFGDMHARVRIKAGKSQEYMAMEIGVSKKTIQNWEKGISSPSFFQSLEWFRILKINPIPYYIQCVFPYRNVSGKKTDPDDVIEERFKMILEQLSITDKRSLVFLFLGEHGSSPTAVFQLLLSYLHTPMKARVFVAKQTAEAYKIEAETGNIVCPENILPDIELLDKAVARARLSVVQKYASYDPIDDESEG